MGDRRTGTSKTTVIVRWSQSTNLSEYSATLLGDAESAFASLATSCRMDLSFPDGTAMDG